MIRNIDQPLTIEAVRGCFPVINVMRWKQINQGVYVFLIAIEIKKGSRENLHFWNFICWAICNSKKPIVTFILWVNLICSKCPFSCNWRQFCHHQFKISSHQGRWHDRVPTENLHQWGDNCVKRFPAYCNNSYLHACYMMRCRHNFKATWLN